MHVYDDTVAKHYAAYRPPLHRLILDQVLSGHRFDNGLDVGCGTGCSTIALAGYCNHVIGVDQSQPMLDNATLHAKVAYRLGNGDALPVEEGSIDLVTFAGAFSYLDAQKTVSELVRVCRDGASILVYDFTVQTDELLSCLGLVFKVGASGYDHGANPSGMPGVVTAAQSTETVEVDASIEDAAHLLLSNHKRHARFARMLETAEPFEGVAAMLRQSQWDGKLKATLYYSLHQLEKKAGC